jgi:fructose-1,6-bisphosphatase/inositol monophosphatase family enzyme
VTTDREVAVAAVRRAGELLLPGFGAAHAVQRKSDASADLVSAADREAEAAVVELLRDARPDDGLLGEEGARASAERTWVVDALDGTFNYVSGVPHWCAAVALVDGDGPLASAVYDPVSGELFSAARREGARRERGSPAQPRAGEEAHLPGSGAGGLRVRTGRPLDQALISTFADPRVMTSDALLALACAGILRTGGAGSLDLAWIAAGRVDAWIQHDPAPWDWLPGSLLVREAGGRADVFDGGWHIAGAPALVAELATRI